MPLVRMETTKTRLIERVKKWRQAVIEKTGRLSEGTLEWEKLKKESQEKNPQNEQLVENAPLDLNWRENLTQFYQEQERDSSGKISFELIRLFNVLYL